MRNTVRLLLCVGALLSAGQCFSDTLSGQVTAVGDGDTITVLSPEYGAMRVRLSGIDAPEIGQPYADVARQHLARLVFGQTVIVSWHKRDRYGRLVGRVEAHDGDAGLALVSAGSAWHFKAYQHEQPSEERDRYARAEANARDERRGLWQEVEPMAPWDFRELKRTSPAQAPVPKLVPAR